LAGVRFTLIKIGKRMIFTSTKGEVRLKKEGDARWRRKDEASPKRRTEVKRRVVESKQRIRASHRDAETGL